MAGLSAWLKWGSAQQNPVMSREPTPASRRHCRLDRQPAYAYCLLAEHNDGPTLKVVLHYRKVVDDQASLLGRSKMFGYAGDS
jgi:hypothetical protein